MDALYLMMTYEKNAAFPGSPETGPPKRKRGVTNGATHQCIVTTEKSRCIEQCITLYRETLTGSVPCTDPGSGSLFVLSNNFQEEFSWILLFCSSTRGYSSYSSCSKACLRPTMLSCSRSWSNTSTRKGAGRRSSTVCSVHSSSVCSPSCCSYSLSSGGGCRHLAQYTSSTYRFRISSR